MEEVSVWQFLEQTKTKLFSYLKSGHDGEFLLKHQHINPHQTPLPLQNLQIYNMVFHLS